MQHETPTCCLPFVTLFATSHKLSKIDPNLCTDDLESTAVPSEAGQESQQQLQQSDGPVASQPTASTANRPSLTIVTNTAAPAGSSLYIGNLQWWTTDSELENLCAKHGQVLNIKTFEDKTTGKSKGYVLVQFGTADSAAACQAALHR